MGLMDKLVKNSTLKKQGANTLTKSNFFGNTTPITTDIPMLNVAFNGKMDGGLEPGVTTIAGPSKHFKSNTGLAALKAFQEQFPEGVCMFYDSEFGATPEYFESFGIDATRVIHIPIEDIEQLKFDMTTQLKEIEKNDDVFIFIDSVGNLASKKEIEDAINQKSVADMTRAKQLKSLFRIVTPMIKMRGLYCVVIAHTYDTQEMFSKKVISGGTGIMYSSDSALIMGRRQVKEGTEVVGWEFVLNSEKSRFIKEKSAIPLKVTYDNGISRYSGILDLAVASGHIDASKKGWATRVSDGKNMRKKHCECAEFMDEIINDEAFKKFVEDTYSLASKRIFTEDGMQMVEGEDFDPDTGEVFDI